MSIHPHPLDALGRLSQGAIFALAAIGIALVGLADYLTGAEISFSIFYLLPIALGAWYGGRRIGLAAAGVACAVWLAADLLARDSATDALIPLWNALVRLGTFAIIASMFAELRRRLEIEERMARTDPLTGALNGRAFHERSAAELSRARRYGHALTLAYIDVDDFKQINDAHGHQAGDRVLTELVEALRAHVRQTDVVSRLGGDELAVLLVETGAGEARLAVDRLRDSVKTWMAATGWVLTLSIGAVTFERPPFDVNEMIRLADLQMYQVKSAGKNGVAHCVWPPAPPVNAPAADPETTS